MFPILLGKNNDLEKRVKNLEDSGGGGGRVDILEITIESDACNKTAKQIIDAFPLCTFRSTIPDLGSMTTSCLFYIVQESSISFVLGNEDMYIASTENDYPVLAGG